MKYMVILSQRHKKFGAYVPDLPGCSVVADSREEALTLVQRAMEQNLAAMHSAGIDPPEPTTAIEYVKLKSGFLWNTLVDVK